MVVDLGLRPGTSFKLSTPPVPLGRWEDIYLDTCTQKRVL